MSRSYEPHAASALAPILAVGQSYRVAVPRYHYYTVTMERDNTVPNARCRRSPLRTDNAAAPESLQIAPRTHVMINAGVTVISSPVLSSNPGNSRRRDRFVL